MLKNNFYELLQKRGFALKQHTYNTHLYVKNNYIVILFENDENNTLETRIIDMETNLEVKKHFSLGKYDDSTSLKIEDLLDLTIKQVIYESEEK